MGQQNMKRAAWDTDWQLLEAAVRVLRDERVNKFGGSVHIETLRRALWAPNVRALLVFLRDNGL